MPIELMNNEHPSLRGHRILVTGASGFIGSWLTEHLVSRDATVTALVYKPNPRSRFVRNGLANRVSCVYGSLGDYDLLRSVIDDHAIDTVFHLAAVSVQGLAYREPRRAFDSNIRGTYNLLEACRLHSVQRVIVASSDKVYGDTEDLPYVEELSLRGRNPYDVSKVCADLLAQSYYSSYGLPVIIGRFGNVYGGGDLNWSRLIPRTIRRLSRGKRPILHLPATGEYARDFLYIKDLIPAYMAMFEGLSDPGLHGEAFNFGTGACWTVRDLIEKIQEHMGTSLPPRIKRCSEGEILQQAVSPQKAWDQLGWTSSYSLHKGLGETIRWYLHFFKNEAIMQA